MNSLIIASVNQYTQGVSDKNGKNPVILNVVSGTFPNRNVLSGTVAENLGIEIGHTYLMQVREVEPNEFGRQFVYSKLKELDALEIVEASATMGEAKLIKVEEQKTAKTDVFAETESEFDLKK